MIDTLFSYVIEKGSNNLLVLLLSGLTITTTGMAGVKLYNTVKHPEVQKTAQVLSQEDIMPTIQADTPNKEAGIEQMDNDSFSMMEPNQEETIPEAVPTATTNTPKLLAANNSGQAALSSFPAGDCVIVVSGRYYDVGPLRSTHSGGDVFECNTDMSSTFQGAHGSNLSMISGYQIAGTPSDTTVTSSAITSSLKHEEEHEDEEYEDEYEKRYEDHEDENHDEDHEDESEDSRAYQEK